jgi:hypothetical protein
MKIAFCGDSFCGEFEAEGNRGYPAWTMLLLKEFNATPIQRGISGDCLFHSYHRLLEVIDDADYIIFCVSEPDRLANKDNVPMNIHIAEGMEMESPTSKDIKKAALMYYKYLINFDFHRAAHLGILMQIDQLILEKKKKCIWFPCFPNSMYSKRLGKGYKITSGPCGTTPLITYAEQHNPLIPHSNHFSKEQNENMFTLVKDIIDKDAFESGPIDTNII